MSLQESDLLDNNNEVMAKVITTIRQFTPQQLINLGNYCYTKAIKHPELQEITKATMECIIKNNLKELRNV